MLSIISPLKNEALGVHGSNVFLWMFHDHLPDCSVSSPNLQSCLK
jgi:hypothetical protein